MTEPTRRRRTDARDATAAGVLTTTTDSAPVEQPTVMRPFVIRNSVDRRVSDRRQVQRRAHSTARAVTQPDPAELLELDPTLRAHVENEITQARAAGQAAGYEQGRAETIASGNSIAAAISLAATDLTEFSDAEKASAIESVIELAERVATVVMNRTPHDGGSAALRRIREVLEGLDDAPFTVVVHPDDLDAVASGMNSTDVMVAPDPSLQPGEARVKGMWSYSELTQAAAWEAVKQALGETTESEGPTG